MKWEKTKRTITISRKKKIVQRWSEWDSSLVLWVLTALLLTICAVSKFHALSICAGRELHTFTTLVKKDVLWFFGSKDFSIHSETIVFDASFAANNKVFTFIDDTEATEDYKTFCQVITESVFQYAEQIKFLYSFQTLKFLPISHLSLHHLSSYTLTKAMIPLNPPIPTIEPTNYWCSYPYPYPTHHLFLFSLSLLSLSWSVSPIDFVYYPAQHLNYFYHYFPVISDFIPLASHFLPISSRFFPTLSILFR